MVDLRVVEVVEDVLVEVLGIEADEVVPYADVVSDLGAGPADLARVLRLLRLPQPAVPAAAAEAVAALTVAELVGRVEELFGRVEERVVA